MLKYVVHLEAKPIATQTRKLVAYHGVSDYKSRLHDGVHFRRSASTRWQWPSVRDTKGNVMWSIQRSPYLILALWPTMVFGKDTRTDVRSSLRKAGRRCGGTTPLNVTIFMGLCTRTWTQTVLLPMAERTGTAATSRSTLSLAVSTISNVCLFLSCSCSKISTGKRTGVRKVTVNR